MHPVFFNIGGLTIHWYGLFMALAFLAALIIWTLVGRREGRDAQFSSDLLFLVMILGIVGARTAYVLSNASTYAEHPISVFFLWKGGLIYYGGLIGGILAVLVFARLRHIRGLDLLDFAMTALPVSHALGRIGCFLNGCCFGDICKAGPSVRFPSGSDPWQRQVDLNHISVTTPESLSVYPVQLYEAAVNIVIFAVLLRIYRKRNRYGMVTAVYLLTYPLCRLLFENLRGTHRVMWGPLSSAQGISLGLMAVGAILLVYILKRPPLEATKSA
jgi:phosphatidylglycerol:prolipoprotein diacylglycerol transferase